MGWKSMTVAAAAALSLGTFGCQSRDVPTAGRGQAVEVGTPEPYPGTGYRLGGSQPPSEAGMVGGVMRGQATTGGANRDPGQIQSGGVEQKPAGHPVLGPDHTAMSYGGAAQAGTEAPEAEGQSEGQGEAAQPEGGEQK